MNQAERWSSLPMEQKSGLQTATIPAEAVDGEFHLQCYAVLPGEASAVILPHLTSQNVTFDNVEGAVGAGLPHAAAVVVGADAGAVGAGAAAAGAGRGGAA